MIKQSCKEVSENKNGIFIKIVFDKIHEFFGAQHQNLQHFQNPILDRFFVNSLYKKCHVTDDLSQIQYLIVANQKYQEFCMQVANYSIQNFHQYYILSLFLRVKIPAKLPPHDHPQKSNFVFVNHFQKLEFFEIASIFALSQE